MGQHSTRVPEASQPDRLTDEDPEWVEQRRRPPNRVRDTRDTARPRTFRDRLKAVFEF